MSKKCLCFKSTDYDPASALWSTKLTVNKNCPEHSWMSEQFPPDAMSEPDISSLRAEIERQAAVVLDIKENMDHIKPWTVFVSVVLILQGLFAVIGWATR